MEVVKIPTTSLKDDDGWDRFEAFSISNRNLNHFFKKSNLSLEEQFQKIKYEADNIGSAEALFCLGLSYEEGHGVRQSYTKAVKYYLEAAKKGHPIAQFSLSLLYEEGLGIDKSNELSYLYCKMSAEQGFPSALAKLGKFFEEGRCVEQSYTEAY